MQTFQKKYISDYNVTTKCNKLIFIRQFLKSFLRKTLVTTPSMEFLIYVFIICLCGYFAVALSWCCWCCCCDCCCCPLFYSHIVAMFTHNLCVRVYVPDIPTIVGIHVYVPPCMNQCVVCILCIRVQYKISHSNIIISLHIECSVSIIINENQELEHKHSHTCACNSTTKVGLG